MVGRHWEIFCWFVFVWIQLFSCVRHGAQHEKTAPTDHGGWPVTISSTVQPSDQMSAEKSYGLSSITSGAVYLRHDHKPHSGL